MLACIVRYCIIKLVFCRVRGYDTSAILLAVLKDDPDYILLMSESDSHALNEYETGCTQMPAHVFRSVIV